MSKCKSIRKDQNNHSDTERASRSDNYRLCHKIFGSLLLLATTSPPEEDDAEEKEAEEEGDHPQGDCEGGHLAWDLGQEGDDGSKNEKKKLVARRYDKNKIVKSM